MTIAASIPTTDLPEKETSMNREYTPTSRLLRSVFISCAVTITVALASFIDLLASERGAASADLAQPAGVIEAQG
jgi:hypothetical protein